MLHLMASSKHTPFLPRKFLKLSQSYSLFLPPGDGLHKEMSPVTRRTGATLTSKRTLTRSSAKVKIKECPFLNIIKVSPGNLEVRIFNPVTGVQFNEEKTIYFFASVRTRNNCLFIVGKSLRWEL